MEGVLRVVLSCEDWGASGVLESLTATDWSDTPSCFASFVNLELMDTEPINGARSPLATVLLENPAGENRLTVEQLVTEVQVCSG